MFRVQEMFVQEKFVIECLTNICCARTFPVLRYCAGQPKNLSPIRRDSFSTDIVSNTWYRYTNNSFFLSCVAF